MPFKKNLITILCKRSIYQITNTTATSYMTMTMHSKQIIKTVVFIEKLTNIERPNHVALDEETGEFQPTCMASRTDNFFSFTTLFQLF